MLTLSTHETKRRADVRARIHLLSEMPGAWEAAARRWVERNEAHRRGGWPDRNAEYLLSASGRSTPSASGRSSRNAQGSQGPHRTDPVADYDETLQHFVRGILADDGFVADLEAFLGRPTPCEARPGHPCWP